MQPPSSVTPQSDAYPPWDWNEEVIEPVTLALSVAVPAAIVFYILARLTGWLPSAEQLKKPPPLAAKFAAERAAEARRTILAEDARRAALMHAANGSLAPQPPPVQAAAPVAPAAPAPSPLAEARHELAKYWAGLVTDLIALDREATAAAAIKPETPLVDCGKSDGGASPSVNVFTAPVWDRQARQARLVRSLELCEREYERVFAVEKATAQLKAEAA